MLPTLELARAAEPHLPADEPKVTALAAVTLAVRVQRRDVRVQRMEIAAPRVPQMRKNAPGPATPFAPATHAVLGSVVRHQRCTVCAVRPGSVPCPFCNLAGCVECNHDGWTVCSTCDGAREIAIVDVKMFEDRDVDFRLTFAPSLPSYTFEQWLREAIDDRLDGPESLLFDVEHTAAFSPYREAEQPAEDDAFHGHRFEDSLVRARRGIARLRDGEVFSEQLRAWARPFLILAWPDATALVLADGVGGVRVKRA